MREAMVNGRLVVAGPSSPEKALCPSCGGAVKKRKRQRMDRQTYFYRHQSGVGVGRCPRRSYP